MEQNNYEYDEIFNFKNKHLSNLILKNPKTFVYEKFNEEGNIEYKLVFIKKNTQYYYFKLVDKHEIILYDDTEQKLYKYNLADFYSDNDNNKQFFDNIKININ